MSLKVMVVRGGRWWLAMGLSASLLACAAPSNKAAVPASAVSTAPVKPLRVALADAAPALAPPPTPSATPAAPDAKPYSDAVAARFPDPAVDLPTPAFAPGHAGFTSNEELHALIAGLVRDGRGERATVKLLPLGRSQSGLPIEGLLFTRLTDTDPAAITASNRPTVMLVGQQHGDEPAGSEALMVVAQELVRGKLEPLLDRINVVMIPRANPDGATEHNRVTASGIDMNRDHLLLKTPEAQAQAQLARDYHPVVIVDSHEYSVAGRYVQKFDAVQKFDVLVQYAMTANEPPFITKAAEEWFRAPLVTGLGIAGFSIDWYHTVSADPADRRVSMGGAAPQLGRNAHGLTNAVSLLVETRGGGIGRTDFKRRVQAQLTAVGNVLGSAASRAADLAKLRQFVDRDVAAAACKGEAVIEAGLTASEYALPMLDPQTGAIRRVTVTWDSALELRALKTRPRPCGYWLAPSETEAVRKLRLLGIEVVQLDAAGEMRGETYRETSREPAAGPGNGPRLRVQTQPVLIDVPVGSFFVSLEQPLANLAIAVLEPESPAGYVANGVIGGVGGVARVLARPDLRATAVP